MKSLSYPKRQKRTKPAPYLQQRPYLPLEIISNILSRLPTVDSLLRCKCVCKSWLSLISDPIFIKTHLKLSLSGNDISRNRFVFVSRTSMSLRSCSVHALFDDSSCSPVSDTLDIKNSLDGHKNWARIVGSCNGLICITGLDYNLSLWNPSTKQSRQLIYSFPEGVRCNVFHGFGYDEANDDYKVVMGYWSNRDRAFLRLYSLKTNSWRKIQDFPQQTTPLESSGKFVNGSLHWACGREENDDDSYPSWVIVSLDLQKEIYREISQPEYEGSHYGLELGVLGGCLCVVCDFQGVRADIWVMKEYGVAESWTKAVSVPYITDPRLNRYYTNPLCISENGSKLLLELGNRLVLYDSRENTLKYVGIRGYDAFPGVCTYVESLISPNERW